MTTQTSGVLNRPPSISELTRPPQQVPITRQGGINLQRTHRRVRNRVHCRSGVASLMWINSDDHILSSLLSEKRGHRDRHADFETHSGNITPLLSQTAAGRQLGGTPRGSQPKEVADDSRANPANDLPDATTPQPQRPVTHIQVGDSICAAVRPGTADTTTRYAKQALRLLARRYQNLTSEIRELDTEINRLCAQANPALLATPGIGPDIAAALLIAAGDNPERMTTEAAFAALCGVSPVQASSGRIVRHRLNRGGNRQANQALWRIATIRTARDQRTIAYVKRRQAEGKTRREIIRCLKRHIAREIYHLLTNPPPTPSGAHLRCMRQNNPNHPRSGRHRPPQPRHAYLQTRTRPRPQPSTRHPLPPLAHHPRTGFDNIGASQSRSLKFPFTGSSDFSGE